MWAAITATVPGVVILRVESGRARQIGQVRAILDKEQGQTAIEIYPSVRAAVDAFRAER